MLEDHLQELSAAAEDESHVSHFSDSSDEEIPSVFESVFELPELGKIEPGICARWCGE